MINVELYKKSIRGRKQIDSSVSWQNSNSGHKLDEDEKAIIKTYKYDRLKNKNIRITCDDNHFLKIPNFCKTYYSFSSDDNYTNNELIIATSELREVFISFNEYEIDFEENSVLFRPYIIDEISNDGNIIERHFIVIYIRYKDNGKIANDEFDFDYKISINKVFKINITYGLPDIIFIGYIIWLIINIVNKNNILELINNPTVIIVAISCLMFIIVKEIFIGDTIIDQLLYFLKIKKRKYYSNYQLKKMIKKYKKQ